MTTNKPNPGHGYIVHEQIGAGVWKEVWRVVAKGEFHDRALARFKDKASSDAIISELRPYISKSLGKNVAELFDAFKGDDNEIYLVEELLYRPLDTLAPMMNVDNFKRIARDLCNGLASLHTHGSVHRDLKLDNCGIDHSGNAKIFDLGSVTSEGSGLKGSILSRAPELFSSEPRSTRTADVWALGAVLYALRTGGDYPFVAKIETSTRPRSNGQERDKFEEEVARRVLDKDAENELRKKISSEFANGTKDLLIHMLDFNPKNRPTAEECADQWTLLLRPHMGTQVASEAENGDTAVASNITAFLNAVLVGEAGISSLQWDRVSTTIESLGNSNELNEIQRSELLTLRKEVLEMRERISA